MPFIPGSVSSSGGGFNIFDINYQIRLNDFYNLTASSYTYYVIARQHLEMLNMIVTGEYPFEFNKKTGKLSYYKITVTDYKITNCECPSRDFHPFKACKHMIRLQEKLNHLTI
jgi:hypothetical protein